MRSAKTSRPWCLSWESNEQYDEPAQSLAQPSVQGGNKVGQELTLAGFTDRVAEKLPDLVIEGFCGSAPSLVKARCKVCGWSGTKAVTTLTRSKPSGYPPCGRRKTGEAT